MPQSLQIVQSFSSFANYFRMSRALKTREGRDGTADPALVKETRLLGATGVTAERISAPVTAFVRFSSQILIASTTPN